jgi:hypothetical protein
LYSDAQNLNKSLKPLQQNHWKNIFINMERITVAEIEMENKVRSFQSDKNPPCVGYSIVEPL